MSFTTKISLIVCWVCFPFLIFAQEKPKNWSVDGYLKSLQGLYFIKDPLLNDPLLVDNLLHNRLNFRWYLNEHFTFRADLRSRIFYGDLVRFNPTYGKDLEATANDFFNLSWKIAERNEMVIHTMLDRLYLEYTKGKWEVRAGRQRINWGINTVWNPNDIFNAYSFTDFDYEERPGSDAIRLRYYSGVASSIEIAAKAFDDTGDAVAGALWKFNKWNYDFQLLAGIVQRDLALGGGWAGNLKNTGFKGEFTYFHSLEDSISNSFALTLGSDYSFENGLYLNGGFLFNSNGTVDSGGEQIFAFDLSAKNLYPYKYAFFGSANYPLSPLLGGGLAVIYSPVEAQALFINPTLTYSIAENWDLGLFGQIIFNKTEKYESPVQAIFMRLKWSY